MILMNSDSSNKEILTEYGHVLFKNLERNNILLTLINWEKCLKWNASYSYIEANTRLILIITNSI